jgi:hypothetical protein
MHDKFPEAFAAADVEHQHCVITFLFGADQAPGLLDVLEAFDQAAPWLQTLCLRAVGLVS